MNVKQYITKINAQILALEDQTEQVYAAANILSDAIQANRLLHIYGVEEESSALIASQFFKAGKPMLLNPMFDPSLDPAHGSYRNEMCRRIRGLAPCILDYYEYVKVGDPIILLGSDPTHTGFSESVSWAQKKQLQIISITCTDVPEADISLTLGSASYADGTYFALGATMLELIFDALQATAPESLVWAGERFVNLENEAQKIESVLFRVKHL